MIARTFDVLTAALDVAVLSLGEARTRAEYLQREGESEEKESVYTYAAGLCGALHEMQTALMDEHRGILQMLAEHEKTQEEKV